MKITRRAFIKGTIGLGSALVFPAGSLMAAKGKRSEWSPAYEISAQKNQLEDRVKQAYSIFEACRLCPRECGVNRLKGETGFCRSTARSVVYSAHPHFGEEISLVGSGGSGTIFFSNCNLRCVFCQNWPIAHEGRGKEISDEDLAGVMLFVQKTGCHNVNLVTPTHCMPNILNATRIAYKEGLRIPLVYNTSGYESAEILKLLNGIVDIYLPDMKFMDADQADIYMAGADDYPAVGKKAIVEMHRQVGLHQVDENGIALRGLMIRHLVMPNGVAGTEKFIRWMEANLQKSTYVNIMHQYHVDYQAYNYPKIRRSITAGEYIEAINWAEQYGLSNLDKKSVAVRDFYVKRRKQ